MPQLLSEAFAEAQTSIVEWEGEPAYAIFEFKARDHFSVRFLNSKQLPVQGLRVKSTNSSLVVNGNEAAEMIFWADTAPEHIDVHIRPSGAEATLKIWNVWRGGMNVTQAWTGNAGMRVRQSPTVIRLLCSDGRGRAGFDDLIAEIQAPAPQE